jgi:hypothetical protein
MILKHQKLIMWSCFTLLILLSAAGVWFNFVMRRLIPMALNDSSPNFSQLADDDRWAVYHQAQSLMAPGVLVSLGLTILWAVFAGVSIWRLGRKSGQQSR